MSYLLLLSDINRDLNLHGGENNNNINGTLMVKKPIESRTVEDEV
jgi:hypothetical protein